jgi:cobalt-zinc-cadmium efflux system protein
MFVVAVIGLLINLIAMRLLQAGSGESLNVKGAYLEVWSDMLGSVAVIVGALLIRATGWNWIDPVLALLIGLWVLPRTWVLLREAVNVLLEGVPKGIDLEQVRAAMREQAGVLDVHDLHVWALASSTPALTAHVLVHEASAIPDVHARMAGLLHERFDIEHVTLQLETRHCGNAPCEQGALPNRRSMPTTTTTTTTTTTSMSRIDMCMRGAMRTGTSTERVPGLVARVATADRRVDLG